MPPVRTDGKTFAAELGAGVEALLDDEAISRAHRHIQRKALAVISWYVVSFGAALLAGSWGWGLLACTSLALSMAGVGFNVQHDANHNALFRSESKRLSIANRLAGLSMCALGASQMRWIEGHVKIHHTVTNVVGKDYDIELGPLARMAPQQPRRPWHRFQHIYLWVVYSFTAVGIVVGDVVGIVTEAIAGRDNGTRPGLWEWIEMVGTKVLFFGILIGVPLFFYPRWVVAIGAGYTLGLCGIMLGVVFQLAHVVEGAEFRDSATLVQVRWHEWQVRSSVDFCHGGGVIHRALTWFVGGLNFQREHHLFPQLPHTLYPTIAPLVRDAAARFGVPCYTEPTLRSAITSHYRHLRALGAR